MRVHFDAKLLEFVFESFVAPVEKNHRVRHFAQPVKQSACERRTGPKTECSSE